MFAIPGILALLAFIYGRFQEFVEALQRVPLLYVFFGLATFGIVLDIRVRNSRFAATPQFLPVVLFFAWCMVTLIVSAPATIPAHALELSVCVALYLVVAHGVQSFRALHVVAAALLCLVLMVSAVGVHQGFAGFGCIAVDETVPGDATTGHFDGRPCATPRECYVGPAEPGATYICERIGLFGTSSVDDGRVRFRGVLQDPNELALAAGAGLPLAFAFGQQRGRRFPRRALVALALLLVVLCAYLTQSRGGQLVFVAVVGAYFARRFGIRGIIAGGLVALPILVLGSRGGHDAAQSTFRRKEAWYEAIEMWRANPVSGVGFGLFGEHHYLTAHNSYLLTLAELGLFGMLLFGTILYLSLKIPFIALMRYREDSLPALATVRPWAMAMIAAFCGLLVGIFFLSFAYHYVLWIYVGLSGALYSAIRAHDPSFQVRFGWRDLLLVGGLGAAIVGFVFVFVRLTVR
jgi:hypothetical protein